MRKVAIVGPECSGKTTLAADIARHAGARHVEEAARAYLDGLGRPYQERDLLAIAMAQARSEDALAEGFDGLMACDTDMITIRIWSEEKYGRCHPWIAAQSERRHYDLFLLCAPDMPWEHDPLREHPRDRDRLFGIYERLLLRLRKPFVVMRGPREYRLRMAMDAIAQLRPRADEAKAAQRPG